MNKEASYIIENMKSTGMIPVFNHANIEITQQVVDAAYQGGVRVFEFTNRGANALEVFKALKSYTEKYEDLLLGIGTIFTKEQAADFIAAGTDFIVSPALIDEVAEEAIKHNMVWIPGCATLTEVYKAITMGAAVVKSFPGNVLGPDFIKAVKSVLPEVHIMPTGGVKPTRENLSQWFNAGVLCVGMGSQLFNKEDIKNKNYTKLSADITNAINLIKELKG
ncbi:bifunctional 4-hydroxy-2-oxoglutarate aldolase/2-dehydro-3-deoxy-phosphogluconate aldolase [Aquimarina sp. ERC-38]|uniref:bifunctional 4-hydroxy-2-oxoglutarate aldolase/2-dehydro-3-deoxy-phosphogluconate aldolase n=1 Tax=Aquimarina sp. ERC-38 TaxID=2949996 RepID=UPI0022485B0F|nr:bifunctional 4-hydroxy-2-oxoglutarate aldolase/2-dehydro-3-deoxy-phosphogluconate aldolase [Aquimarina sp. ERC-38]UZO81575.1 bifunctional 4-hydroxy-2-oxoglutarate aldolase/2-dehydro-3-deoxy-phosphogluconate aldolase [Aquimarina sp. ERC-38]